jgi:hypothetical protein
VIFLSAFPAYWSTGILGQHRTVNSAYFFFLVLWFMNLTVWVNFLMDKKITANVSNFAERYFSVLFIVMVLFSFITGNGYVAVGDLLSGRTKNFDRQIEQRYEKLQMARQHPDKACLLDSLQNKPASLFVLDISADENDWVNRGMAAYYGIGAVGLK